MKQYDVVIPPYKAELLDVNTLSQIEDWGWTLLEPESFYPRTMGEDSVVFILDTEDDFGHPDLVQNNLKELNRTFTGSPTKVSHGHGIHCAGIATAANNSFGIIGIAPGAKNVAVKVLTDEGYGNWPDIISGIRYVADLETPYAKIISMSLGGSSGYPDLESAINYAIEKGCFVVAAAGNRGYKEGQNTVDYPGKYPQVITVASIGITQDPSTFSSAGEQVDFSAPGEGIYSTHKDGGYAKLWGTSMATPQVAGIVALFASYHKGMNQYEMMEFLKSKATDLWSPEFDVRTGWGVPVVSSYKEDPVPDPDPPKEEPTKKSWYFWAAIAGGVIIAALIAYFTLK